MKYLIAIPVILCLISSTFGQLVSGLLAFLFVISAIHAKSQTYNILAVFMVSSAALHYPLTALIIDPAWWPAFYSAIDLATLIAIMSFADKHKTFQSCALVTLIILHLGLLIDTTNNSSIVFDWYYLAIMIVIGLQIIGGFSGDIARFISVSTANIRPHKRNLHDIHHRKGSA